MKKITLIAMTSLIWLTATFSSSVHAAKSDLDKVKANVEKNFPIAKVKEVKKSGLPGIYMVAFESGEILYSNGEATKLLRGELFVVEGPGQIVNHTENYVASQRVESPGPERPVVFSPTALALRDRAASQWKSMLLVRSKQRSLGAAISTAFTRRGMTGWSQVKISFTTLPWTSVSRNSRPWKR